MKRRPSKGRKTKGQSKAAKAARGAKSKFRKSKATRTASKAPAKRKITRKKTAHAGKKTGRKTGSRSTGRGRARKDVFGEGNYTASREFRREQTGFVQRNRTRIPQMGEAAAQALEGTEGNELTRAEDAARAHSAGEED